MTTRGRSGPVRAVLGSTASDVVARTPSRLWSCAPTARCQHRSQRCWFPSDGSTGSALALGAAKRLADGTRAQVTLLQVVEPISTWASVAAPFDLTYIDPEWEQAALAGAREYVDQLVERLRARDVVAVGLAKVGDVRPRSPRPRLTSLPT